MLIDPLHARFGRVDPPVFRLGLSATYRPSERTVRHALDEGINYLFFLGFDWQMTRVLRDSLPAIREKCLVATGAYNLIWTHQGLKRTLEKRLRQIGTDYIDVFHFLGVTRREYFTRQVRRELEQIRADGRVRSVSISCHDPEFATELLSDGVLDAIMIRYNAANRTAEEQVFATAQARGAGVTAYTATAWTYLLRAPKGWPAAERVPDAGMCYRFVLSNPSVDLCLTAPRSYEEFLANLAAVRKGPLDGDEIAYMRHFGDAVADSLKTRRDRHPAG